MMKGEGFNISSQGTLHYKVMFYYALRLSSTSGTDVLCFRRRET